VRRCDSLTYHSVILSSTQRPSDLIRERLSAYLGPFSTANALKLFAKQALSTDPDSVTREQVPALLDALAPMLRTLLGKAGADKLLQEIRSELAV
jgi:hypothetical protein